MVFPPFEPDRDEQKRRRFRQIPVRTLVPNLITVLAICAELDSLADFVNFGVAPALILYFWDLHELRSAGWIAALVFAICAGLRLARFNGSTDDPNRPAWGSNFFVGMSVPETAITVLLPISVNLLGGPEWAPITFLYTLLIAFLMVSRLPVFSGKRLGTRVPREMVLPVF